MSTYSITCCNRNCDQHAPLGVTMYAESYVCHHCNKQGHYKGNCPELANGKGKLERNEKHFGGQGGAGGGSRQTWCSFHNTTTRSDSECYTQGAPRRQQGSTCIFWSTQRNSPHLPDGDGKTSELNFGDDFEGGFLVTSTTVARTFLPNGLEQAIPVDLYTTDVAPSTFRGLLRTATIIIITETGIITFIRDLWELLNHGATLDKEKPLTTKGSRP